MFFILVGISLVPSHLLMHPILYFFGNPSEISHTVCTINMCVPFCFLYRAPASRATTTSYMMTTTSLWMTCRLCPTSCVTCSHDATAVYPTLPRHTAPTWLPSGLAIFCKTGRIRGEFKNQLNCVYVEKRLD